MTDPTLEDRLAIRQLVEDWAIWRDAGEWSRFRTCWHADGVMMATWTQGTADAFVAASQDAWRKGVSILHFLGGHTADVAGDRAVAQTKMTISQRAEVHGVVVDVVCTGRFCDCLAKRDGRWAIVLRQPIFEKDRMDPVDPAARLVLDPGTLRRFPVGYRHLAYLQTQLGYDVKTDMPGLMGAATDRLRARGTAWLAGASGHPADAAFGAAGSA
ncbi:nuclear transport factor 2 family protein [Falsiroseomonas sp. HW251]|uniref:nuclear transport factor 2 family protein n=1 Tax=Falsiroseomonas sp. HW251 TaxID=3390998 RepID=UPI003D31466B